MQEDKEIADVLERHRKQRYEMMRGAAAAAAGAAEQKASAFPPELFRRFEVRFLPRKAHKVSKLRDIRAKDVGSLVKLRGIVTRVSDVQPLVQVVSYICTNCGWETFQVVSGRQFTPLAVCPSEHCKTNQLQSKLIMQTRGSKFIRYQDIKLQELPEEVPVGHTPRSMKVRAYGDMTRRCLPGDIVHVSGIFLPSPYSGFRALRAGLTADVYLQVMQLEPQKKSYAQFELTDELRQQVQDLAEDPDIYNRLASSIAPEIYGHTDVKKALLLLLVGGVTRKVADLKIRGDINILLMGDPGVAKSQLLKHISYIAPRAIYTTGKGSSGVGLTAAVVRDQNGDMTLEGGALVLSDMGICCIDEFDKMEEGDRTAIHEVMEQQTVSIAKAGITTTLNARTAVLAAANPVFGRWNKKLSPEKNLGLPTALLSRFDLLFIILDKPDEKADADLARHVTYVHRENKHPPLAAEPLSPALMRAYISEARKYEPWVPPELTDYITSSYVKLRKDSDKQDAGAKKKNRQRFCTARSLLSILRLSQALARIHFRNEVTQSDVEEAMRLLSVSKQLEEPEEGKRGDPIGELYNLIMSTPRDSRGRIRIRDIRERAVARGFSDEQLTDCIAQYEAIEVWFLSSSGEYLTLLNLADHE